jgi:hypothetical protein
MPPQSTAPAGDRPSVFLSCSHQDRPWLDRLNTMLAPLVRTGAVELWWDGQISPGKHWREEIDNAMASARVAVLLVSAPFLASEFIATVGGAAAREGGAEDRGRDGVWGGGSARWSGWRGRSRTGALLPSRERPVPDGLERRASGERVPPCSGEASNDSFGRLWRVGRGAYPFVEGVVPVGSAPSQDPHHPGPLLPPPRHPPPRDVRGVVARAETTTLLGPLASRRPRKRWTESQETPGLLANIEPAFCTGTQYPLSALGVSNDSVQRFLGRRDASGPRRGAAS